MSFVTRRLEIESFFKTAFDAAYPIIPVAYDNQEFKPGNSAWVRFTISDFLTQHSMLGQSCTRTGGLVLIQVFTPRGSGAQESDGITDFVSTLFRGTRLNNSINFWDVTTLSNIGLPDAAWYQSNETAEYLSDNL